jgi:transposase
VNTNCENCKRLEKRLAELEQHNQELELQVRELLARLNSNSSNSHKPPSSDPPKSKSGRLSSRAKCKGRKHRPGIARQSIPPEKITNFVPLHPDVCRHCGFDITKIAPTGHRVSQQIDLPEELQLIIREFHLSVRQTQRMLLMLLGSIAKISEGTIINVKSGTSRAAASVYREVRDQIQKSSTIWADETGWFYPGTRPWLWVAASEDL